MLSGGKYVVYEACNAMTSQVGNVSSGLVSDFRSIKPMVGGGNITEITYFILLGFPGGSAGKGSTCNAEVPVQFLGWEDLLEK